MTHKPGIAREPTFEIKSDVAGKYRFHLKAANEEIVAASQAYKTRQSVEKGIASVKKNASTNKILDLTSSET